MKDEDGLSVPQPLRRIAGFEKLAYGMFIHWGLYSQLGRGEWIRYFEGTSTEEYRKLMDSFGAEDFDGRGIAKLAKQAGMKYIVLTARHHEGFSLYDTCGLSDFDALHSPAGRDLVADFVAGCRAEGIVPFFYHTTLDWSWGYTQGCVPETRDVGKFGEYLDYLCASVEVLCRNYGQIGGLWFDGNWSQPDLDWQCDKLYGMIRKLQPEAMIINNTGLEFGGKIGHGEIDSVTFEQSMPGPMDRRGHGKYVAGEMCETMNLHWGVAELDLNYKSPAELVKALASSRKVGANYLLNVGLTGSGAMGDLESAILRKVGKWVEMCADVIYEGKAVSGMECSGRDFVLEADGKWYYFAFDLGIEGHEHVTVGGIKPGSRSVKGLSREIKKIRCMDNDEILSFVQDAKSGLTTIEVTGFPYGTHLAVRVMEILF